MLFLLQRDAHEEPSPPADSVLTGSHQTAHHLQLQDLKMKHVGLWVRALIGAGELKSLLEAKEASA